MKMLCIVLFALAASCVSQPAHADEKIVSVDGVNGLVTIDQGGTLKSFRVKQFTEITLNGVKTTLDQIRPNMVAFIGLSDGQTLSTLAARGNPPPAIVTSPRQSPKPVSQPGPSYFGTAAPIGPGFLGPPREGARRLVLKLSVDAKDTIKIGGGRLWIEHNSLKLPKKISINGVPWAPTWKDKTSEFFTGFTPALVPFSTDKVSVRQVHGRGKTTVVEPPTSENQQTLSFQIQDHGNGADAYEVQVTW